MIFSNTVREKNVINANSINQYVINRCQLKVILKKPVQCLRFNIHVKCHILLFVSRTFLIEFPVLKKSHA